MTTRWDAYVQKLDVTECRLLWGNSEEDSCLYGLFVWFPSGEHNMVQNAGLAFLGLIQQSSYILISPRRNGWSFIDYYQETGKKKALQAMLKKGEWEPSDCWRFWEATVLAQFSKFLSKGLQKEFLALSLGLQGLSNAVMSLLDLRRYKCGLQG